MNTSPIHIVILIALSLVACSQVSAQNTNSWESGFNVDKFTDKKNPYFVLEATKVEVPPSLSPRKVFLMLSCPYVDSGTGKLERFVSAMIYFSPELSLFNKSFTYRFDKLPSQSLYEPSLSTNVSLGRLNLSKFLTSLSKSNVLLIRVGTQSLGGIDAEFDLSGSKDIKNKYLAACGPI